MIIEQRRIKTIDELSNIKETLNPEAYFRAIEKLKSGSPPSVLLFTVKIGELPTELK